MAKFTYQNILALQALLKPCPFCGGEAEVFRGITYGFRYLYEPRCIKCECALGIYETEEQAIEAWNRRDDSG